MQGTLFGQLKRLLENLSFEPFQYQSIILLDLGLKRSEMKHTLRAKRMVSICFIWRLLKVLSDIANSMIATSLPDEGFGKVREIMVISM